MQKQRTSSVVLGRRIAASALIATLVFGTSPIPALAATSTELQAQLDQAQAESATYEQQTAAAFQELEDNQAKLEDTKAQISTTEEEISQKQDELDAAQSTLSDRVSADYKAGGVSIVDLVVGSTSASDLVSRIYYANKVASSDAQAIQEVQSIQAELDQKKADLQTQQAQQQQLVDASQAKATEVQQKQADHEAYVQSLSADVQQALAEEEAARKAAEEAAAQKAAEEAAAQQAQQQAAGNGSSSSDNGGSSSSGSSQSSSNSGSSSSNGGSGNSGSSSKPSSGSSSHGSGSVNVGSGISGAIAAAKTQLGVSYSWGGNAIAGQEFDCSGLVWWAYKQAGISIPRGQRMSNGRGNSMIGWALDSGRWTTNQANLQPGDLMFWGQNVNSTTHVGMYIGGGRMIHSNYGGVEIASVYYMAGSFVGGGPVV